MKRRHESTIDNAPMPQAEGTENAPRQIFKKRRTVDNWGGLGKRRSLRDINNLFPASGQHASIPYDEKTTSKVTQGKTQRESPISSVKQTSPTSNISPSELSTSLHGPRSEHQYTPTNSRPPPASVPVQRASVSEPAPSLGVGASGPIPVSSFPRFVLQDKPVRITQSQISQQAHSSRKHLDFDSDQEDEGSDSDESDDIGPGTEEVVDSDEKQRVESNYSEINK
ncbi:unnamed protein product [Rhizoctonia solani]|uniref:Uncharacterized protein n=1 Tax=Rhizoctonia solani TaxID=456999 RepID=A0A8H3DAS4_9AGAM|nr:unnamed protein product [Rhizoctonia solani]